VKKSAGVCGNMGAWWAMAWRWSPECTYSPKLKLAPTAGLATNADMGPTQVRDRCPVDETGRHAEGARRGDAADEPQRAGVSPGAEAGADDRGPGGE
jgi:hypothetical protein